MKISEIEFEDEAFKTCALESGFENAEDVVKLTCRNKGISNTKGLEYFTGLKLLDVTRNQLEELNVSNNIMLEELFAGNNQLISIDLSSNPSLKHLEVFINELTDLDVTKNKKLEEIYANKNELTIVDLKNNHELLDLRLSDNELATIDLKANTKLERLFVDKNEIPDDVVSIIKNAFANIDELRI